MRSEIPEWERLSPVARALLQELAAMFAAGVDANVRFQMHQGGVRDTRAEVDLRRVRVELRRPT